MSEGEVRHAHTSTAIGQTTNRRRDLAGLITALVLVGVLIAVIVVGDRDRAVISVPSDAATPAIAPTDATSSVWYCAAGSSEADGLAAEAVLVTNVGAEPIDADVTVLPSGDVEPVATTVTVEAHSTSSVAIADVLVTPEPGVVVETFGGDVFVEHRVRRGDDVAFGPCATTASTEWYFASGTTAQGAQQVLVLFNPFGEDASVDVSFVSENGFSQPERLQGLTVPRRSRVSIPIHDEVSRQTSVATHVSARIGRVVAEQMLLFDGSESVGGRTGIGVSLGATSLASEWTFPWAGTPGTGGQAIAVANFGTTSGELTIATTLDGEATLADQTQPIPPRTVALVDLASGLPADLGAAVTVRASRGVEVIAEQFAVGSDGGIATMVGGTDAFPRWAFSNSGRAIAIVNPSANTVEVVVTAASGDELARLDVAAGGRAEVADLEGDEGGPVVVEAAGPVLAVRVGSLTVSPGVVGR